MKKEPAELIELVKKEEKTYVKINDYKKLRDISVLC